MWTVIAPQRAQPLTHLASGVAVDQSGTAYISDPIEHRVKKIGFGGKALASWGNDVGGHLHWSPQGIAVSRQGIVYVLTPDQEPFQVQSSSHIVATTTAGKFIRQWPVGDARAVAVGGSGNLFVAVAEARSSAGVRATILKFAARGRLLRVWHTPYLRDEEAQPNGIVVDRLGNVYVTVATNNPTPRAGPFITRHLYRFASSGKPAEVKTDATLGAIQAIDPSGDLWFALSQYESQSSGEIEKLSPGGEILGSWVVLKGEQLADVHVAAGAGGALFVSDTHNISLTSGWADATLVDRITPTGSLLSRWGTIPPYKNFPLGIRMAVGPNGGVYPTTWGHGYMSISPDGHSIHTVGKLNIPAQGIARDAQGNIYIDVNYPPRIYKYAPNGHFLAQWAASDRAYPSLQGMTVDREGLVYVIDGGSITQISPAGQIVATLASPGTAPGQLSDPQSLTADASGHIYVADTQNNRIEEFTTSGRDEGSLITMWPRGPAAFNLDRPIGVAVDAAGHVFALEGARFDIVEFAHTGSVIARYGVPGVLAGQLDQPTDIALGPHNSLYVLDYGNDRVQRVSL